MLPVIANLKEVAEIEGSLECPIMYVAENVEGDIEVAKTLCMTYE